MLRLIGVTLLCQYEHLNCMLRAWSGHLNGIDRLLKMFDEWELYLQQPSFQSSASPEVRVVFWHFVLQDLEESCELQYSYQQVEMLICISRRPPQNTNRYP